MDVPWVSLILLGVAASFLPLQFGLEIALLGSDDGLKKGTGLIGGISLFRIAVLVGIGLIFTGLLAKMSTLLSNVSTAIASTINQLHLSVRSGQHVLFDVLIIAFGVILLVQATHHWRNRKQTEDAKDSTPSFVKRFEDSTGGLLALGFAWTALSLNQWLFTTAALGQILSLSAHAMRFLAAFLFLLIGSLMLLLPILLYLFRPEKAQTILGKVDHWLNEAMPIVVIVVLAAIGLFFIIDGGWGMMNSLAGQ